MSVVSYAVRARRNDSSKTLPSPIAVPNVFRHSVAVSLDEPIDENGLALPVEVTGMSWRRRTAFIAGRWCARHALALLDPALEDWCVGIGVNRAPVWPHGILGSITHTEGFASAAVARSSDVWGLGIDVERLMSRARAEAIASMIALPDERALAEAVIGEVGAALTFVFSAKESVFKCLNLHVGPIDWHDVTIDHVDPAEQSFRVRLLRALSLDLPAGGMVQGQFVVDAPFVHTAVVVAAPVYAPSVQRLLSTV